MFQVTPGYGSNFATYLKGGAHHQQVVTHADRVRTSVSPFAPAMTYADGQLIGGELIIPNVTRLAGEAAVIELVTLAVGVSANTPSATSPLDLDLVLYTETPVQPPADRASFVLEAGDLPRLLGVVRFRSSDFVSVGGHRFAALSPTTLGVVSGAGTSAVRAVLVARSLITLVSAGALTLSLVARRD